MAELWRPRFSVKLRFALSQGIFVVAVVTLLAGSLYVPVRRFAGEVTTNAYSLLASTLSAGIFSSYQDSDLKGVSEAIRRVEGQQGVRYVLLTDGSQNLVYDSLMPEIPQGTSYRDTLTQDLVKGDTAVTTAVRDGVSYYVYTAPFVRQNQLVYTIRLGVERATVDGQFFRLASLFIWLAGLGCLIAIIATYFLTSRLTRPILQLTESALAIRAGNLNAYPQVSTNDELEQLAREFQNMVEKLKAFYFSEYRQKKEALAANEQLADINARLQELDRQKTDFLNAASHQLRTPLSVIHWSLSLIIDESARTNISAQQKELLDEALKSTKRMVDLVNQLLDLSRIEQGRKQLNWEQGNVAALTGDLVKALQPLAGQKRLTLTYQCLAPLVDSYLDKQALYQIVNNFVDNAIKYTETGGVTVTVQPTPDTQSALIMVADTGIGMTEDERKRLFTRFSRGDDAEKLFANGSGLGMYVAKALLDQHGGTIAVTSAKGSGTTFSLTIPLYQAAPPVTQAS